MAKRAGFSVAGFFVARASVAAVALLALAHTASGASALPLSLSGTRGAKTVAQDGPRWAARGSILAVERRSAAGPVVELIDTRTRRRTEVPGFGPAIGDQGRFVAVQRLGPNGPRVVVCELQTGRELVLPGLSVKGQPIRWAPDGPRLLVTLQVAKSEPVAESGPVAAAEVPNLFLLDLTGKSPELLQLTRDGGRGGRWLGGNRVIYEVPDARGASEILIRDHGGKGSPRRFWTDEPFGPPDPARIS